MEFVVLVLLIVLNGVFAMSELAIVSSSKSRLQQLADKGNKGALTAIQLASDPNRFLSTVQIGITLIGIIAGAFGGSAIAGDIAELVRSNVPALENYAEEIGFAVIVTITTYLSLVIGELVPKRIALRNPERMAAVVARPMLMLSNVATPLVWLLSKSTELVSRLLGFGGKGDNFITDYDVFALMREGMEAGEFDAEEHAMVMGALELDDRLVREILTPRIAIVTLDIDDSQDEICAKLAEHRYSAFPVCGEDVDDIIGVVRSKDLLSQIIKNKEIHLVDIMHQPLFVPETVAAKDVLRQFKQVTVNMAIVINEHGGTEGIITLNDIVEEVLGDVDMADPEIVERPDGSWLIDGHLAIDTLTNIIAEFVTPADEEGDYNTLAGFVLKRLGHIPQASDTFTWQDYRFEVVDMDGKRIDKVLVSPM